MNALILIEFFEPLVCFHRAFDMTKDPLEGWPDNDVEFRH